MLSQQRKAKILDLLQLEGQVVAKSLAQAWGLSEDTIRRDLRELAKEGKLQRVHGGALPASPAVADFGTRQGISTESKRRIGRAAADLIRPGQIVMLDGGTTTAQVARHLPLDLEATIVTHSPSIAMELIHHTSIELILIGGTLYRHSMVTVGTAALDALSHIRADLYMMGVTGIHVEVGLTTGNLEEGYMKRAMSRRSAETVVLGSSEKLGVASPYLVMPISDATMLLVESSNPPEVLAPFRDLEIELIQVTDR